MFPATRGTPRELTILIVSSSFAALWDMHLICPSRLRPLYIKPAQSGHSIRHRSRSFRLLYDLFYLSFWAGGRIQVLFASLVGGDALVCVEFVLNHPFCIFTGLDSRYDNLPAAHGSQNTPLSRAGMDISARRRCHR
jgi:hypothetical protein